MANARTDKTAVPVLTQDPALHTWKSPGYLRCRASSTSWGPSWPTSMGGSPE